MMRNTSCPRCNCNPCECPNDHIHLLDVGDGPEGIDIYTSEEGGVVDWSNTFPAVYVCVNINGASAKFGPFTLPSIYTQLAAKLAVANG